MNITDLKEIQALLDQGYRMLFYKEENDPRTPEPGPYRLMVFKFPRLEDKPDHVIASGETMEAVAEDIAWVKDFDGLLQIAEHSPGPIGFTRQEITLLPEEPLRTLDPTKPIIDLNGITEQERGEKP